MRIYTQLTREQRYQIYALLKEGHFQSEIARHMVHFMVTRYPTDNWLAQQLREATPFGAGSRSLIRVSGRKYGTSFSRVAFGAGIDVLRTPYRAPKINAICERFLGSLQRECLDHFIIYIRVG